MYLVRVTPPMNFTFSDDSLFLKKILGGGHKFSEFACFYYFRMLRKTIFAKYNHAALPILPETIKVNALFSILWDISAFFALFVFNPR